MQIDRVARASALLCDMIQPKAAVPTDTFVVTGTRADCGGEDVTAVMTGILLGVTGMDK